MEDLKGFIENYQRRDISRMVKPDNILISYDERFDLWNKYRHKVTGEIIKHSLFTVLSIAEKENYLAQNEKNMYEFRCVDTEYDVEKIYQDTLKKCLNKNYEVYDLQYHEYAILNSATTGLLFNSLNGRFTPIDELINNNFLHEKIRGPRSLKCDDITRVNTSIVDDIISSLINDDIKNDYKKLAYSLIVKPDDTQVIFYDYDKCLLSYWLIELLWTLGRSNHLYVRSFEYYENKLEFKKLLKQNKPRCVIIDANRQVEFETQIKVFSKLGFKKIIVRKYGEKTKFHNVVNFQKYISDNKERIADNFICDHYCPNEECENYDELFYKENMLFVNYLKWCIK